ncbi:hypothetical protein PHLGIDRAFT_119980 [Phlebiopsis gigantea 11061_1 CR5-6]|uniref:Uncharacterized protein n=1 Tax=Phlebiopsis gigantea (strain 11061_1 CR5-6) TaxID=745531 RepID=A0A0C3PHB1_PHLG1|nr:hypothetical protein PHLGIDRAFT_119980 [Phlebiopsis gigantea 11061_1 CR5-6]
MHVWLASITSGGALTVPPQMSAYALTDVDIDRDGWIVGAMSYALVQSLSRRPVQTYQELLPSMREVLRDQYSQKPRLSSSHRLDTGMQFVI